jgi:DNA excision repair protein ERCC-4
MDNSPDPESPRPEDASEASNGEASANQFEEDEEAMRDMHVGDEDDDEIMEVFATQGQVAPTQADRSADGMTIIDDGEGGEDDEPLMDIGTAPAPPVFEPMQFDMDAYLTKMVERRMKKGHEAVLEEQPKWSLLAKVLKEIEDTIARVSESHAGEGLARVTRRWLTVDEPGTNIVLVMCASDRTCLQLRTYLTSMVKTDPPFGPQAGRKMMETMFLSNWQHERHSLEFAGRGTRMTGIGGDEVKAKDDMQAAKRQREQDSGKYRGYWKSRGQPSYKRRRMRAGAAMSGRQSAASMAL